MYPLSDFHKDKLLFRITVLIRYLQFCHLLCSYSNRSKSRSYSSMISSSSSSNQAPSSPLTLFLSVSFIGKFQTSTESLPFLICQPHMNPLALFRLPLNSLFQRLICLNYPTQLIYTQSNWFWCLGVCYFCFRPEEDPNGSSIIPTYDSPTRELLSTLLLCWSHHGYTTTAISTLAADCAGMLTPHEKCPDLLAHGYQLSLVLDDLSFWIYTAPSTTASWFMPGTEQHRQ